MAYKMRWLELSVCLFVSFTVEKKKSSSALNLEMSNTAAITATNTVHHYSCFLVQKLLQVQRVAMKRFCCCFSVNSWQEWAFQHEHLHPAISQGPVSSCVSCVNLFSILKGLKNGPVSYESKGGVRSAQML